MKRLARIGSLAAVLVALTACTDFKVGLNKKLVFYDQTDTAKDHSGIRSIAEGATIYIGVSDDTKPGPTQLTNVTSAQPAVLAVQGFNSDLVTLHAGNAGTARITAKTATGTQDSVDLDVEAIASDRLDLAQPENTTYGFAMIPGAKLGFQLVHLDAAGAELTGFGAEPISATPASALVQPQQDSDGFDLVAPSTAGTSIELQGATLQQTIDVVDPTSVASIDLARTHLTLGLAPPTPPAPPLGSSFTEDFSAQQLAYQEAIDVFDTGAYLADGRYVFGECPDFAFSAPGGASDYVSIPSDSGAPGRIFVLQFKKFGTATFSVTCFGRTATYAVTIESP